MKAVIFDMDGVIFDTERLHTDCWLAAAEKFGIEGVEETVYKCIGTTREMTKEIFLQRYGIGFEYDKIRGEVNSLIRYKIENGGLEIKPGAVELLEYLKSRGIPTAIGSSTVTATARPELEGAGLLKYFRVIVGGDMVSNSKPAPDIFLLAAEKLGVSPGNCIVIEDSRNGIRAAHAAGMMPIMVPDLLAPDEEIRRLAAAVLDSLGSVMEYFVKGMAGL